jgi:ParB family chromosome partitioning protein
MSFAAEELQELSRSIQEQGIIQPLVVRKDEDGYELVAGERRWRAARLAGLSQVPVILREVSDAEMLEISIVENIQRENLNPMEECEAYHCLMTEFSLTQEEVAARVGKSRSAVANFLRLRQLSDPIIATIKDGTLSMGHARALLGAQNPAQQEVVWRAVVSKGLSVRETEALVKRLKSPPESPRKSPTGPHHTYFLDVAEDLSRHFGTKVQIQRRGKKGKLVIEFYDDEDLDHLLGRLKQA